LTSHFSLFHFVQELVVYFTTATGTGTNIAIAIAIAIAIVMFVCSYGVYV